MTTPLTDRVREILASTSPDVQALVFSTPGLLEAVTALGDAIRVADEGRQGLEALLSALPAHREAILALGGEGVRGTLDAVEEAIRGAGS